MFDLLLITPELPPRAIVSAVRAALTAASPGRVGLQLRAKHLGPRVRAELATELRALSHAHGVPLLINADLELALEVRADGVQLPERGPSVTTARAVLGAGAIVGASRHDREGVLLAAAEGANFATLSPIFAVPGKGAPLGLAVLQAVTPATRLAVFALGGMSASNAGAALTAGAHGVAIVRDVLGRADPGASLTAVLAAIDGARAAG